MPKSPPPSDGPSEPCFLPALPPDAVARLAQLTRDYSRLSHGQAGFSGVLGGVFLLAVALVELAGHGWRFTWVGALAPLPLSATLAVALLPFLWFGARQALRCWTTARFGLVEPTPTPPSPAQALKERIRVTVGRVVLPALILLGLLPIWAGSMSAPWLRTLLLLTLAIALPWCFILLKSRLERLVALLLFFGAALLLASIQMAAGDTLLAYPVIGAVAIGMGCRDHVAFRRVKRELGHR